MTNKPYLPRNVLQAEIDVLRTEGIHVYEMPVGFFKAHPVHKQMPSGWTLTGLYTAKGFRFRRWTPLTSMFRPILNLFPKPSIIRGRSILIREDFPDYMKFTTLLHEKGHDICCQSKCICTQNSILQEAHAWEYVLSTLLQRKLWSLLRKTVEEASETVTDEKQAIEIVSKSALWKNVLKQLGTQ